MRSEYGLLTLQRAREFVGCTKRKRRASVCRAHAGFSQKKNVADVGDDDGLADVGALVVQAD